MVRRIALAPLRRLPVGGTGVRLTGFGALANPYATPGPPRMRLSVVCYADILGYGSLTQHALRNGLADDFLVRLHRALSSAHQRVRQRAEDMGEYAPLAINVFTDNIVVGYPLSRAPLDNGEPEMSDTLGLFAEFQIGLAMEGFFVRGGVAYGRHYMDQDVVFGDALLEAVGLDAHGGPPRLVLAQSALHLVKQHFDSAFNIENSWYYDNLLVDIDGAVFLDYLAQAFMAFPDGGVFLPVVEAHRDSVIAGLRNYRVEHGVFDKYRWAAGYHNFVCRDFTKRHPISHDPDEDEICGAAAVQAQRLLDYVIEGIPDIPVHRVDALG